MTHRVVFILLFFSPIEIMQKSQNLQKLHEDVMVKCDRAVCNGL